MNRRRFKKAKLRQLRKIADWSFVLFPVIAALAFLYFEAWSLLVYPVVLLALILRWLAFEWQASRTEFDGGTTGSLDHVAGMFFVLIFVMPALLFLLVWSIYILMHTGPIDPQTGKFVAASPVFVLLLSLWRRG